MFDFRDIRVPNTILRRTDAYRLQQNAEYHGDRLHNNDRYYDFRTRDYIDFIEVRRGVANNYRGRITFSTDSSGCIQHMVGGSADPRRSLL